jgi:iron complex transport system substrate-binding protein
MIPVKINNLYILCALFLYFFLNYTQVSAGITKKPPGATASEKIVIEDCIGRTVKIPREVKRIACLYAFSGHAVTMLGRCEDIVAVSNGLKRDSLLHSICPSILETLVPKAQGAINIEELLKAQPDLVFLPSDIVRNSPETAKLDRFDIPYLVVDYGTIKGQQFAIEMIGKAIGASERAAMYNDYYNEIIEKVIIVISKIPEDQNLHLYYSVNEVLRTTLNRGLTADWLKIVGVENVALREKKHIYEGKNYVSLEQVLLWNPDVILANEPGAREYILKSRQWSFLKSVQDKKVFQMPIGISRWGHPGSIETPLAILWTVTALYPERFRNINMFEETKNYYKKFFNYELSDALVKKILSGKMRRKPKNKTRHLERHKK